MAIVVGYAIRECKEEVRVKETGQLTSKAIGNCTASGSQKFRPCANGNTKPLRDENEERVGTQIMSEIVNSLRALEKRKCQITERMLSSYSYQRKRQ